MSRHVGIVLINFSGTKDTLDCLDSLAKIQTNHMIQVYVVHYVSNSGLEKIHKHSSQPTVIVEKKNLGFAGMNNLGIRQAIRDGVDVVVLLNNDTTVDPGFIDPLVEQASKSEVGLVSPKIYFSKGKEFQTGYKKSQLGKVIWYGGGMIDWQHMLTFHQFVDEVDRGQIEERCETDFATGCCLAFKTSLIDQIGYMPEKYFMYLEDVSWSLEMKRLGLKVLVEPESKIWHKNASASGGSGSNLHKYYQTRNRILFAKKYAPMRTKLAVMKKALKDWRSSDEIVAQASFDGIVGRSGMYQAELKE